MAAQPRYGQRLLPVLTDEIARSEPQAPVASRTKTVDPVDGFIDISYADFARAIDRCAWWLEWHLGKSKTSETIAYVGPNDFRYSIMAVGANKAGYKVLFTSPRNSLEGHLSLFKATGCTSFLYARSMRVDDILEESKLRSLVVPELEELLHATSVPHYPFDEDFESARDKPFFVLHTSGSTGLPKPIVVKHGLFATCDTVNSLEPVGGLKPLAWIFKNARVVMVMPAFHAAGMIMMGFSVYMRAVLIYGPPGRPVNADMTAALVRNSKPNGIFVAPSILEDMSKTPEFLDALGEIDFISYGGGPLSQEAGDILQTKSTVCNFIGSTEMFLLPSLEHKSRKDWRYQHFHPTAGVSLKPREGGLAELVIVRKENTPFHQGLFYTFPDAVEYPMKDLYTPHPTVPDLWLYSGRADDLVVLSNGEKINPLDIEEAISNHPDIRSALVVGQAQFQPALLVELQPHSSLWDKEDAERVEAIWPIVEQTNSEAASYAKLSKDRIMFTKRDKSFLRAPKGTIQRQQTNKFFAEEIEQLYEGVEELPAATMNVENKPRLAQSLRDLLISITKLDEFADDDDLFTLGMDSLMVIALLNSLKSGLRDVAGVDKSLSTTLIYRNPTLARLTNAVWTLLHPEQEIKNGDLQSRSSKLESLLDRYSANLPSRDSIPATPRENIVVALTGSTGSLGSYLLDALLNSKRVQKIYCLNRSASASERQKQSNVERGLRAKWTSERVEFLLTDFSKPRFGLSQERYSQLLDETTDFIHNAWQVDFNLPVESFEKVHIQGVRSLIDFSIQSAHSTRLYFISSISTVMNWAALYKGSVPEETITDFNVPEEMGYGESKYIGERLLDRAHRISRIPSTVCRVGQVGGPVEKRMGMWNKQEWLPTIIASSKYLRALPSSLPGAFSQVDWLPVDTLARIVLELIDPEETNVDEKTPNMEHNAASVYHLVNPNKASWDILIPTVQAHLAEASSSDIDIVPVEKWLALLRESAQSTGAEKAHENPGVKLLEFFEAAHQAGESGRATSVLQTGKTTAKSATLNKLEPVNPDWMKIWLEQWKF
ncbi:L-aminoadipate-semialdehyde dehydrogenase [Xylona heveae TC161]|uniref:L-aminoadipate-semialdehyde dehydrogenase n=1 Tax=Xylona heveae (strain CBS 132557 / TC161) TaxID=1328760 RepID=A0A165IC16_XYLHT|nr:L-aminoadipate-semialdehyde dehydrogenase [Xylona heveae TC161]KZF24690.1 L-aminoadipate-semialdehyde dehydrogenase [Xylona heveae TC161]